MFLYVPCLNISRSGLVWIDAVKISRLCVFTAAARREGPRGPSSLTEPSSSPKRCWFQSGRGGARRGRPSDVQMSTREDMRSACTVSTSSGCLSSFYASLFFFTVVAVFLLQLSGSRRDYIR